ncbi:MAG: hypothetical protein A3K19_23490 [Lentisphaerae bacterium RIFOXYB12_FULL_65_16]|nr:MAG: hypothetical protein A3K18_29315 [Lentisphaerae bacterium RIFOXYA12_64_32]OGV94063.1 MAG: hypothetical protein A3K19_23490 [Lentisphaerae bacterium RIFOXYB12_FULL_65_16]
MKNAMLSLEDVRTRGFEALVAALGSANALRFIGQYDLGHGDYTHDRFRIVPDKSAKEIFASLQPLGGPSGRGRHGRARPTQSSSCPTRASRRKAVPA